MQPHTHSFSPTAIFLEHKLSAQNKYMQACMQINGLPSLDAGLLLTRELTGFNFSMSNQIGSFKKIKHSIHKKNAHQRPHMNSLQFTVIPHRKVSSDVLERCFQALETRCF